MNITPDTPIRIVAVSPYEALTTALRRTAEDFPGVQLEAYTGDLQEGAGIIRKLDTSRYDVVLSRGGTADLIRAVTDLPVIEIPVSVYDVLRTIKLSENYTDRYAVIGFPGVTENAHTLCNLLRLEIPIETVRQSEEVLPALARLRAEGYHTVICDMVSHRIALEAGFNAILITSGENSLHQALQEAEAQGATFRRTRHENLFLQAILRQDSRQCMVFNQQKELVFSFTEPAPAELLAFMRAHVSNIPANGEALFYHQDGSTLHTITASSFYVQGERYFTFRVEPAHIPLRSAHIGIRAYDQAECRHLFNSSFFTISGSLGELEQRMTPIATAQRPVLIVGEGGTGKEQIARALYLRSRYVSRPFIMIDATRLNEKSWDFLLEHHASPLSSSATALCFQRMEEAPPPQQRALLSLIEETGLSRRLWLIFSCDTQEGQPMPDFCRALSDRLGPLSLHLPTLRSRRDEIPALASLYIDSLNNELGRHVSGVEPDAMKMLVRYDWPGNYTQFKHALHELTVLAGGPYVTATDVAELLARERKIYRRVTETGHDFTLSGRTLDEITQAAVRQALNENVGNHTLAARQLGISRTTLWRMLGADKKT